MDHVRLKEHITHKSGHVKTICVTACLTALGVPVESFHYTGGCFDNRRQAILRKSGYAVRSRMSKMGKNCSVGRARTKIAALGDPAGTRYLIVVNGHALLLDADGTTIVDTAPRLRDRRIILTIYAVYK